MLGQPAHVFAALEERLAERSLGPTPPCSHALGRRPPAARPDREGPWPNCRTTPRPDDPAAIDEEWEEKPVSFTAHEMGGPTGMLAGCAPPARRWRRRSRGRGS